MKYQPNQKIIEVYSKRAGKDVKYFEFLNQELKQNFVMVIHYMVAILNLMIMLQNQ